MAHSTADALQERFVSFAVKIIDLVSHLPKTTVCRHISGQVLRSGTSPAPNYAEARGAESRADFIHKLRIAVKELHETGIWLRIILKTRMAPEVLIMNLISPLFSQGFVARRFKRMWMQGLRPKTPEAYFRYVEESEGA